MCEWVEGITREFGMVMIMTGVKSYLIVVLIYIFLVFIDVLHCFVCLLIIRLSSLEEYLDFLPIFY